ncbi:CMGC/SRPK protein kinase [Polytolypa hystricis UAMH7299]|uniref:CMGC/SRPK protein kinase n=1 Tax=Polytolypa hystricis (strain UAMH7299) TaxID=1447883 RepID=A0A2B7YIQ6_POLH7|nr:CMGC/SRPK protein kinase [Polytolypa hystricis UAMH7299]
MQKFLRLGRRALSTRPPSPLRAIRNKSSATTLDPAVKIEEERMPGYEKHLFYPVHIGEVFKGRQHRYTALKVYICHSGSKQEGRVLQHLQSSKTQHPGKGKVRMMLDIFEIDGPDGSHQCLVNEPLVTSILHFQAVLPDKSLGEDMLKPLLQELLVALDYLNSEAQVVHTDIQAKNIMIGTMDPSIFSEWESQETENLSPRKVTGDYTIYQSRPFKLKKGWRGWGLSLLCDFGAARIGSGEHEGLIQPSLYRAPEVVLGMKWTLKVDIWNLGVLIWDLFEDHHMFDGRGPDKKHSDAQLLAEMVALLGETPIEFLHRSQESLKYWDDSGTWKGVVEIPEDSLEDSEVYMEGKNKELFIQFMRKMLT